MANTYDYVNETGVIVPDTSDIKATVESEYKSALGQDLDTTSSTPQGRLIEAETLARTNVLATNALIANQLNPNTASGVFLDAQCAIVGVSRKSATKTEVLATVTGVAGTVIPAGAQAQTNAGDTFQCVNNYTIPAGGTGTTYFQATETGPVPCAVNTLTQIVTGTLGWETINNPSAATIGVNVESDDSLRARRSQQLYTGVSMVQDVATAVEQVPGVLSVYVNDNDTNGTKTVDGVTLAAHSLYVVVDGGTDQDVAQAIFSKKSLGCAYTGTTTVTVTGPYNVPYTVKFNRPTYKPIEVVVTVSSQSSANVADIQQAVKDALSAWANGEIPGVDGLGLGVDVSPFEAASAITAQIPDLFVTSVALDFTGGTPDTSTLTIKAHEKATLAQSDITVTVN